jgi:uncharacterized protein YjbI with pentapeptide repeats
MRPLTCRRLTVESLESRSMLDGGIPAVVAGGKLEGGSAESIWIEAVSLRPDAVRSMADSSSTINGDAVPAVFDGVKGSVHIAGNDRITIRGVRDPRHLVISSSSGDDIIAPSAPAAIIERISATASRGPTYRDCSERPLVPGADLRRCDLRPLPLAGKDVHGANMSRANLAGMNLDIGPDDPRTNLTGVRFHQADLSGTIFSNTILVGADLMRAMAPDARFEDAVLDGANLSRADLRGSQFFFAGARGARFLHTNLAGAELRGSGFRDADFRWANLRNVDASRADFQGANLSRADLTGANLTRANLSGARLHQAKGLNSVTWSDTTCPDGTNSDANNGTCVGHL